MAAMFGWIFDGDRTLVGLRLTGLAILVASLVMMVIALVQLA